MTMDMQGNSLVSLFRPTDKGSSPRDVAGRVGEGTSLLAATTTDQEESRPLLLRHDSTFSVSSDYLYPSPNNLRMCQGALLLTAEQMGTGILALPSEVHVLGKALGLTFLILNLPMNYYAGLLLQQAAEYVEQKQTTENRLFTDHTLYTWERDADGNYHSINRKTADNQSSEDSQQDNALTTPQHELLHHDTATFDFIGMSTSIFSSSVHRHKYATLLVMAVYYANIFLVLGNYILVMSHAVQAVFPTLCLPMAGIVASTGMFVVCQSRTMARLGRTASVVSLGALALVVVHCLWVLRHDSDEDDDQPILPTDVASLSASPTLWAVMRKCSALGSIGFACGSQKLYLNVRHEMQDRKQATTSLAWALGTFGSLYVLVILLAGPRPPNFLFDAIPVGPQRRVAGLWLWIHVIVSYAINSQAICASLDRLVVYRWMPNWQPANRWMVLTAILAVCAYLTANAIPFFKDLVALIGAATSIPLTLLLPALLYRKFKSIRPLWLPSPRDRPEAVGSFGLVAFSVIFMAVALTGVLSSIAKDWSSSLAKPFACRRKAVLCLPRDGCRELFEGECQLE